jgi:HlyD family secretion protein
VTGADPSPRRALVAGTLALAVLVLGFGLWATTARLSSAVVAPGRVVAQGQNLALQHPDGGRVAAVLVAEGDRVRAGQVLLRLDGAALRSELLVTATRRTDLAARIARLEAERDGAADLRVPDWLRALSQADPAVAAQLAGQQSLLAARAETERRLAAQLRHRIAQGEAERAGIAAQRAALSDLIALVAADLDRQAPLVDRGLARRAELDALLRDAARLAGEAGRLDAAAAAAADRVAETEMQLAALAASRREAAVAELRDLWPALLELAERQRSLTDRVARLDLRAPADGRVLGLRVTAAGAVLPAAETALHVVPDAPLVVLARIGPRDRARIAAGQAADLVFQTAGSEPLTRLTGQVVGLSADVVAAADGAALAYEVTVALPPDAAQRLGPGPGTLGPGLPVEVYLRTGEASPVSYLTAPLARYLARAWREG